MKLNRQQKKAPIIPQQIPNQPRTLPPASDTTGNHLSPYTAVERPPPPRSGAQMQFMRLNQTRQRS